MNKSKLSMPLKARKKMNKEVKSSALTPEPKLNSDDIKAKQLLSSYPAKVRKKDLSLLKSFEKTFEVKKKKQLRKQSKRTTPGLVFSHSAPKHVHVEGERWIQTRIKQTRAQNTILNRKVAKKGPK